MALKNKIIPYSKKQLQALSWWMPGSPVASKQMLIAEGAIRSGKTVSVIDSFMMWSQHTFQNQNFIIAGKSIGALRRNVLQPLFTLLEGKGIPYQYSVSQNKLMVGTNTYYCFGAVNEASQDTLQGLTAAGALADEVALFPRSFVEQMLGRCSVEGAKYFITLNPESPLHYFKTDYIDQAVMKNLLVIHFTLDDNPSLSEEVKDRFKGMFSGIFYRRYIDGEWVIAEGAVYDMWDEDKHVIAVPTLDKYPELYVAVDYATSSVMTFGLYGVIDGIVYLVKEYYYDATKSGRQKTDSEYADDFIQFIDGCRVDKIYIDPSASSFKAELRKRDFRQVVSADNDVINGIRLVSTFLGSGRFFIDNSCTATRKEFTSYSWDSKAQAQGIDKPLKVADHAMDRNRYFIYTRYKKQNQIMINKPHGW